MLTDVEIKNWKIVLTHPKLPIDHPVVVLQWIAYPIDRKGMAFPLYTQLVFDEDDNDKEIIMASIRRGLRALLSLIKWYESTGLPRDSMGKINRNLLSLIIRHLNRRGVKSTDFRKKMIEWARGK